MKTTDLTALCARIHAEAERLQRAAVVLRLSVDPQARQADQAEVVRLGRLLAGQDVSA